MVGPLVVRSNESSFLYQDDNSYKSDDGI
jgi:hypothetical protein